MDVLVLLVGRNPLPNWVVFESLVHAGAPTDWCPNMVLLVHSGETGAAAERLRTHMAGPGSPAVHPVPLTGARDGQAIRREVTRALADYATGRSVQLNYTGGTKEMAVSAYAAVRQAEDDLVGRVTCSYLDARGHCLRFDDRPPWPTGTDGDLRQRVTVRVNDLLALHGFERSDPTRPLAASPLWPRTADAIFTAVSSDEDSRLAYRRWVWQEFVSEERVDASSHPANKLTGRLLEGRKLRNREYVGLPSSPVLEQIGNSYVEEMGVEAAAGCLPWDCLVRAEGNARDKNHDADRVAGYFHGKWLEHWLWQRLRSLVPSDDGWTLHGNVEARRIAGKVPAEVDVLLIRGYQLFVFSCTTARERGLVKSKGFEAIQRCQQFGGDEARPFLVTLLPLHAPDQQASVTNLREDLAGDGQDPSRLRVWGLQDLRDLDQTWRNLMIEEGLA